MIDDTKVEDFETLLAGIDETAPAPDAEPMRQYYFIKKARKLLKEVSETLGRPLTACTVTFGCQVNTEHEIRKAA